MATVPTVGVIFDGKYTLVRELGRGASGTVFEAEHLLVGKHSALKVLHPSFGEARSARMSFVGEARIAASLSHANITDIYDIGVTSDGLSYLVMELLQGSTWERFLRDRAPVSPTLACELSLQAMAGLAAAHGRGILHRNLKPSNLYVTFPRREAPLLKILDLGLAQGLLFPFGIEDDTPCGDPRYLPPEQATNDYATEQSDLYSWGAILFELLSARPIAQGTDDELWERLRRGGHTIPWDHLPALPDGLRAALERTLSPDPTQRPASAAAFAELIHPYAAPSAVALDAQNDPAVRAQILAAARERLRFEPAERDRDATPDVVTRAMAQARRELSDSLLCEPQIPRDPISPKLKDAPPPRPMDTTEPDRAFQRSPTIPSSRYVDEDDDLPLRSQGAFSAFAATGLGLVVGLALAWWAGVF